MSSLIRLLQHAMFAAYLALAPTYVEAWRLDPTPPPGIILAVGEPMRRIGG